MYSITEKVLMYTIFQHYDYMIHVHVHVHVDALAIPRFSTLHCNSMAGNGMRLYSCYFHSYLITDNIITDPHISLALHSTHTVSCSANDKVCMYYALSADNNYSSQLAIAHSYTKSKTTIYICILSSLYNTMIVQCAYPC